MSQRQEFVELALQENANIRALCREFGITPRTGYKWIKRYQEEGNNGLYDRSRRPHHSPFKSSALMEEARITSYNVCYTKLLRLRNLSTRPAVSTSFILPV